MADRAYRLWQEAGAPAGRDQEYWFAAERQLHAAARAAADQGES